MDAVEIARQLTLQPPSEATLELALKNVGLALILADDYWLVQLHQHDCIRPIVEDRPPDGMWLDWARASRLLGERHGVTTDSQRALLTLACSLAGKGAVDIAEAIHSLDARVRPLLGDALRCALAPNESTIPLLKRV